MNLNSAKNIILLIFIICLYRTSSAQTGIWEELNPTNSPSPRYAFGMAEIGVGKVLIFGGIDNGDKVLDETWIFDFNENTWIQVKDDIHPSNRYDLRMSRITKNKVLLFGGWNPTSIIDPGYYGDTWVFDLETQSWNEIKPKKKPSPRRNFGLAQLMNGKVLLLGGDTVVATYSNDTWIFDIDSNNWIRFPIFIPDPMPPMCEGAMMAQIDTGKILFYGGWQFKLLDQTLLFDINEGKWIYINPKNNPIPIASSSMANINKNGIVFWGGDNDSYGHYDEMWLFNLIDSSWKNIQTNIKPDGRYLHKIVNFGENKILLFGGLNNKTGIDHNDTWLLTLQPNDVIENNNYEKFIDSYFVENNMLHLILKNPGLIKYRIYDIYGKIVKEKDNEIINDGSFLNVDVSGFPNGMYFLLTQTGNEKRIVKILVSR
jgi:N-acetylneuraminic acid mutarotase